MRPTDEDPDAPPWCDGSCGMSHRTGGKGLPPVDEICPKMLTRQRYQYRRWARRHPVELDEYREQRRRQ